MDVKGWQSLRRNIHEAFQEDLFNTSGCGAFDGGCLVIARALQKVIGGDLVVLVRGDDTADHAAVLHDGKIWDWDGPMIPFHAIRKLNNQELKFTPWMCVAYRGLKDGDLPEAFHDDALEERLAHQFREMLPSFVQLPVAPMAAFRP